MIIHRNIKQGTEAWLQLRAGVPTSSQFDRIVTPRGAPSKSAEKYMFQLLAERIMGEPTIQAKKLWWADRGKELEKEARAFYEFTRDVETEQVGFITNDEGTIGASPDSLVGPDGLVEFKSPSEAEHVMYLLKAGSAYEEYKVQVQGQLMICEDRQWVDVCSYHPLMPPALIRIERDEEFQKILKAAVYQFSAWLEDMSRDLTQRGWMTKPFREPQESEQDRLVRAMKESLIEIQK